MPDPELVERFLGYRMALVKALHDAGAGLLLGSDAPQVLNVPGFSIHTEIELLIDAGLTPAEALATGTIKPARFLGENKRFGCIEAGLEADLILTRDNPLVNPGTLKAPLGVLVRGKWFPVDAIESRLAEIAARYAEPET